jgi:hypothetical protein
MKISDQMIGTLGDAPAAATNTTPHPPPPRPTTQIHIQRACLTLI